MTCRARAAWPTPRSDRTPARFAEPAPLKRAGEVTSARPRPTGVLHVPWADPLRAPLPDTGNGTVRPAPKCEHMSDRSLSLRSFCPFSDSGLAHPPLLRPAPEEGRPRPLRPLEAARRGAPSAAPRGSRPGGRDRPVRGPRAGQPAAGPVRPDASGWSPATTRRRRYWATATPSATTSRNLAGTAGSPTSRTRAVSASPTRRCTPGCARLLTPEFTMRRLPGCTPRIHASSRSASTRWRRPGRSGGPGRTTSRCRCPRWSSANCSVSRMRTGTTSNILRGPLRRRSAAPPRRSAPCRESSTTCAASSPSSAATPATASSACSYGSTATTSPTTNSRASPTVSSPAASRPPPACWRSARSSCCRTPTLRGCCATRDRRPSHALRRRTAAPPHRGPGRVPALRARDLRVGGRPDRRRRHGPRLPVRRRPRRALRRRTWTVFDPARTRRLAPRLRLRHPPLHRRRARPDGAPRRLPRAGPPLPGVELAVEPPGPEFRKLSIVYGVDSLPVRLG